MLEVKQADNSNRQSVVDLIADHWGSSIVVTRGKGPSRQRPGRVCSL